MILSLPEELIEQILSQALTPRHDHPPQWLHSTNNIASLLVSRQLTRIGTPLLYNSIVISSQNAAAALLRTLHANPEYAGYVRDLTLTGKGSNILALAVLKICKGLHSLDFSLMESEYDCDYEKVFGDLSQLRHLTLRKPSSIYLTQVQPRSQLAAISLAVPSWPHLRTASIAFKLCDDTPLSPITALANALALSPSLRTFSTIVPSMWTTSIATISSNPSLQRICLSSAGPSHVSGSSNPIPNTGLFMTEARRHPHLAELIVAGTQVLRCRAKTLPSSPVPGSGPSSSLPSSASPSTSCPPSSTAAAAHAPKLRIDTSACSSSSHRRSHSHSSPNAINPAWMAPASASASGSMSAKERKKANRRSARF